MFLSTNEVLLGVNPGDISLIL